MAANFSFRSISYLFIRKAIVALLCFVVSVLAAAADKPDVRGFEGAVFDYHFKRAGRELNAEAWMQRALEGISLARSSWERLAADLYGDPLLLLEAGKQVDQWAEEELGERYAQWLMSRFFGAARRSGGLVVPAIREANLRYAYHTDDQGNIIYNPDTGDPEVVRPGEEGRNFNDDRILWRDHTNEAAAEEVEWFSEKIQGLYPELLSYLPEEQRVAFEERLQGVTAQASDRRRRELEALVNREERLFVARRTGDIWSLRKKSDQEAASAISARLISETSALCAEGIAALEERIEAAEGGQGDLALAGYEWLTQYREQFERGLKAWEQAEERFFVRRIEWEQEAGKNYLEGEKAWQEAFGQLEKERQSWELKAKALFESGEAVFRSASEKLELAITEARGEFERDAALRAEAGSSRAKAWLDIYVTSGVIVAGAREHIDFWLDRYRTKNAPGLGDEFERWISTEIAWHWQDVRSRYERQSRFQNDRSSFNYLVNEGSMTSAEAQGLMKAKHPLWYDIEAILRGTMDKEGEARVIEALGALGLSLRETFDTAQEMDTWNKLYKTYIGKTLEARDALISEFGLIMGEGGLADILAQGVSSEDFCLDEYQIELIRSKAVAGYWEKRVAIARSVTEYAEELSAGRMTDSEGVRAWEEAKAAYDEALKAYEAEQKNFTLQGAGVNAALEAMNEAARKLEEADRVLENLNREYSVLMGAYAAGRNDFILEALASKYRELLGEHNLLSDDKDGSLYVRYLEKAYTLGLAQKLDAAGRSARELIAGSDGGSSQPSLAALAARAAAILVLEDGQTPPLSIRDYGLDPGDPYYESIRGLLAERNQKMAETAPADSAARKSIEERYAALLRQMTRNAKARTEVLVENRIQGLRLLTAGTTALWYFNATGTAATGEDGAPLSGEETAGRLRRDSETAARTLLQCRIELEIEALDWLVHGGAAGDKAKLLSEFFAPDFSQPGEALELLRSLWEITDALADAGDMHYRDAMETAALGNQFFSWFIQGGSFFGSVNGRALSENFLPVYLKEKERSEGLLAVYEEARYGSGAAAREAGLQGFQKLAEFFVHYGITIEGPYLPGVRAMAEALMSAGNGKETGNFLYKVDQALTFMPEWIVNEAEQWKSAFLEYMAARLLFAGEQPDMSGTEIETSLSAYEGQFEKIQDIYEILGAPGQENARVICAVLAADLEGLSLFNREFLEREAARRIGENIAKLSGAALLDNPALLRRQLAEDAAAYHGYAGEEIRKDAVEEAERLLYLRRDTNSASGFEELEGEAGTEAFRNLLEKSWSYLPGISGNLMDWALRQEQGDGEAALKLADFVSGYSEDEHYNHLLDLLLADLNELHRSIYEKAVTLNYAYRMALHFEQLKNQNEEAEQENKKHWRQYITEETLDLYNLTMAPEGWQLAPGETENVEENYKVIKGAGSFLEGILADVFTKAERLNQGLQNSFALFAETGADTGLDFIASLASETEKNKFFSWDDGYDEYFDELLRVYQEQYYAGADELYFHTGREISLGKEIEQLGYGYAASKEGSQPVEAELDRMMAKIEAQRAAYQESIDAYRAGAEEFAGAGSAYDGVYRRKKDLYAAAEDARFQYEKQDAIRRWASTAYLEIQGGQNMPEHYKSPLDDLAYSQERLNRANIALEALKNIYHQGEERRPYDDLEYENLYREYEASFSRMLLSFKARDIVEKAVEQETKNNAETYGEYRKFLNFFEGNFPFLTLEAADGKDKSLWKITDMIRLENGKLVFAYNNGFTLQELSGETVLALNEFFHEKFFEGTETNPISSFEESVRELMIRMNGYGLAGNPEKYRQWGLARDYLIQQLLKKNPGVQELQGWYKRQTTMAQGTNLGDMQMLAGPFSIGNIYVWEKAGHAGILLGREQYYAWAGLSAQERADLEFYSILTLMGGGGKNANNYFSRVSERDTVRRVLSLSVSWHSQIKKRADRKLTGWMFKKRERIMRATRERLESLNAGIEGLVGKGETELREDLGGFKDAFAAYTGSCDRLAILKCEKTGDDSIRWEDLRLALESTGGFTSADIGRLRFSWENMEKDTGATYQNIKDALADLSIWSRMTKDKNKLSLERAWQEDEYERKQHEQLYREESDRYISGRAGLGALNSAAQKAYGNAAPAWKNHLENLAGVVMNDLAGVIKDGAGYSAEYVNLAGEYVQIIRRVYGMRYSAELAAREAEWDQQRRDIEEKWISWQEAAGLILERGREDWKSGSENFLSAYNQWQKRYEEEYQRVSGAWSAAYLAGLEDKEAWVRQASDAADKASSGAMLALVGADAEMLARKMDTRLPLGGMDSDGPAAAEKALQAILGSAGIVNMEGAFGGIRGAAGTMALFVRSGAGGISAWDSGHARIGAALFAKETNAALAEREAKKIAAHARDLTAKAIAALSLRVDEANDEFRESMDNLFLIEGQWQRSGKNYLKDIIVHSTLFNPVITDRVVINAYSDYLMQPVNLKTDLSDGRLKTLDTPAVDALIQDAFLEIRKRGEEIFGTAEENANKEVKLITITKKKTKWVYKSVPDTENGGTMQVRIPVTEDVTRTEKRILQSGEFGRHIGYDPVVREGASAEDSKGALFDDFGAGQLGALMTNYIYWNLQEGKGVAAVNRPGWEKPLWDSRNSRFKAPSIKGVVNIGMQVVGVAAAAFTGGTSLAATMGTMALSAGINLTDDLIFSLLDVAGGYKTWGEAGFEFGKSNLLSMASSSIGVGFNSITSAATKGLAGLSKVATETALTGMQGIVTSTVTSALSAVTYDRRNGFGWSSDIFDQGMLGGITSAATGMTSQAISGTMNLGLEGFLKDYYINGTKLSNLSGGFAAQGLNYALGGDFTVNLMNLGDLTKGKINTGLLEMHFGREGTSMNLGTSGIDVSAGNVWKTLKGLESWKQSARILFSKQEVTKEYASQMRTLYSEEGAGREEYEAMLAGKTKVVKTWDEKYNAQSIYDEASGIKTIYLGSEALDDTSRYGLNVVFSHESYRDGKDSGEQGQVDETYRAVEGHNETAMSLVKTYGAGAIEDAMLMEALFFDYALRNGNSELKDAIMKRYESEKDYWLLKTDGNLVDDGSADLHWEAVKKGGTAENPVYKTIMSFSGMTKEESLVKLLGGDERAADILRQQGINPEENQSGLSLGELLVGNLVDSSTGLVNIAYSQLTLNRDWHGLYTSYITNQAFLNNYMPSSNFPGNKTMMREKNQGDTVTTPLEYYTLLYEPLKEALGLKGTDTDPIEHLKKITKVFTFDNWSDSGKMLVNNNTADNLEAAFTEIRAKGEALPSIKGGGGLWLRFQGGTMTLSKHATGEAIDFEPGTNGFYEIPEYVRQDPVLQGRIFAQLGMRMQDVKGWDDNQRMAEIFRERKNELMSQAFGFIGITDEPSQHYRGSQRVGEISRAGLATPALSFSLSKTFVDTMRKYFDWGGDWTPSKDYMHFEQKEKKA